jgi:hypothetical protein
MGRRRAPRPLNPHAPMQPLTPDDMLAELDKRSVHDFKKWLATDAKSSHAQDASSSKRYCAVTVLHITALYFFAYV